MFFENHKFPTVDSVIYALEALPSSRNVVFEVGGEILHPVRFGTYPDPMAFPDQFIFVAADAPYMTAGELANMMRDKLGTNMAKEAAGIEGLVHGMVHVMAMISTPEKEASTPLSLADLRVEKERVVIEASEDWWNTFEVYFKYWNSDVGNARISAARMIDVQMVDLRLDYEPNHPDLHDLYTAEFHPKGYRYLDLEAEVRLGVKDDDGKVEYIWVRLVGKEERGRDLAYWGQMEAPPAEVKFREHNILEIRKPSPNGT